MKKDREAELEAQLNKEIKDRKDFETELDKQLQDKRKLEQLIEEMKAQLDQRSKLTDSAKDVLLSLNKELQAQLNRSLEEKLKESDISRKDIELANARIKKLEEELRNIPRLDLGDGGVQFQFRAGDQSPRHMMEMGNERQPLDTAPRYKVAWYHGKDSKKPDMQYMSKEEVTRLARKYRQNGRILLNRRDERSLNGQAIEESIEEGKELEIVIVTNENSTAKPPEETAILSTQNRAVKAIQRDNRTSPTKGLFANMLPVIPSRKDEVVESQPKRKKILQKREQKK